MFYNQLHRESKSIWEPRDTMLVSNDVASPSLIGSQTMSQYPSSNRPTQQYKQAWIVEGPHENQTQTPKNK